jgi:predicted nuclease of predicted toxin-antitoxin system
MAEDLARQAGRACAQAGTSDIVDATVAVLALARDDLVVTSDEDDLHHLASTLGRRLKIHRI